jgi:hypothetical protein
MHSLWVGAHPLMSLLCVLRCRRPRRLGGGKGGESRAPRPPKDPKKQFVLRLIDKVMSEK